MLSECRPQQQCRRPQAFRPNNREPITNNRGSAALTGFFLLPSKNLDRPSRFNNSRRPRPDVVPLLKGLRPAQLSHHRIISALPDAAPTLKSEPHQGRQHARVNKVVSSTERSYVCAFRGRRDGYQVPLALAEAGQLDQFITDLYLKEYLEKLMSILPFSLQERLGSRRQAGIPADRVRCLWSTTVVEHARHALGFSHRRTYSKLDRQYAFAARDRARKTRGDLFLYSPYAWEAFTAQYAHSPRRVLFQFHPHPDFENRLLRRGSDNPSRDERFLHRGDECPQGADRS